MRIMRCDGITCTKYDAQLQKLAIVRKLLATHARASMTRREIAERMSAAQSTIARLEGVRTMSSMPVLSPYVKATGTDRLRHACPGVVQHCEQDPVALAKPRVDTHAYHWGLHNSPRQIHHRGREDVTDRIVQLQKASSHQEQ